MRLEAAEIDEVGGQEAGRTQVEVELYADTAQILPLPDGVVKGGARVLELQAACGFRAFAEQRLRSTEPGERVLGLDAKESGTAVHVALERFWAEVVSQRALLAMTSEEVEETLARAIDEGLRKAEPAAPSRWESAYVAVQRERLRRLLLGWLEMERGRPEFEVMRREGAVPDVRIGPLRLQLRVDRVDLVDGAQVLIDYKTGLAKPSEWLGDRPDAPQVPLYAVLAVDAPEAAGDAERGSAGELGAVAFGNVRVGRQAQMKGFAAREGLLPGRMAAMEQGTFEGQVERWREVLGGLAKRFAEGNAEVQPKNYPTTCQRCGQRMLCRLDASLLEDIADEETGEDADA